MHWTDRKAKALVEQVQWMKGVNHLHGEENFFKTSQYARNVLQHVVKHVSLSVINGLIKRNCESEEEQVKRSMS